MPLRQMKTAMDVRIRQQRGPSFQNPDVEIRQAGSMRIRGSFALREEVIAELPERYRKALLSMPYRQQEKILSEIEKKIDRKMQSGALAKTAARLDADEQAKIRKMASSGQGNERKQAVVSRYRLEGKAGYGTQRRPHSFNPSSMSDGSSDEVTWQPPEPGLAIDPKTRAGQMRRLQVPRLAGNQTKQGKEASGQINGVLKDLQKTDSSIEAGDLLSCHGDEFTGPIQSDVVKRAAAAKDQLQRGMAARNLQRTESRTRAGPKTNSETKHTSINIEKTEQDNSKNIDIKGTIDDPSFPNEIAHRQRLLASARNQKERLEIQKAILRASEGKTNAGSQRILQGAALRAAYADRAATGAYSQILKEAGFVKSGQKAAAQLAYEKQIMKTLKGEYRKQLTGKLSKLKTTSVMKKAQMQKVRQEQAQEDEMNRSMTEQTRESFGLMAKGTKVLKKLAADAAKAIRTLIRKKLAILVIPLLLAMMIPFLMMLIPILGTATATSYEDNEVYAYADATELIEYAKQWIGKIPYVWGGGHGGSPTAWQSGCDCSGFVHGVFNHFGYEIGGDTGAMETQAGTHIAYDSLAQAKPGDVLIYYRTSAHVIGQPNGAGSTHVSIYIGNNQIIHQSGGVHISNEYHQYFEVRRVLTPDVGGRGNISGGLGGMGTYGHRTDSTNYSRPDLELIWAIVAQEDNGSYKGALAVISSAMNRVESPTWSYEGSNALAQLTAPGQYCYSNDTYWQARLGGNVPDYVKQAVNDCLKKGKRNHNYTSFRSTKGKTTGADAVQIGGNWFFGH